MSLSPKEKTLLVITIYTMALLGFVWFLYLPQQAQTKALQAENQQLTQDKIRWEGILQKQKQQSPASAGSELAAVKEQIPPREEMIPVLKYVNDSTQKCNVELASLEYQGAKEAEGAVRTLTFAVETSGSIFDLIDFLQQLMAAPRFISVVDISLNACQMENSSITEEKSTPMYYITAPGIPEAKLERMKADVEEMELVGEANPRVADSFVPDQFDMKVTINTYYLPEQPVNAAKDNTTGETDTVPETAEDAEYDASEGSM